MTTEFTCPPGTHPVVLPNSPIPSCVPNHEPPIDVHPVPVADTLSLTGLALAILVVALARRRA